MIAPMIRDVAAKLGDRARVAKMDSDKYPELSTELQARTDGPMQIGRSNATLRTLNS